MTEVWTADLTHADELEVNPRDIVLGAAAYVVIRGGSIWGRRWWMRVAFIVMVLTVAVSFIPPWLLIPILLLSGILWLIASPTNSGSDTRFGSKRER